MINTGGRFNSDQQRRLDRFRRRRIIVDMTIDCYSCLAWGDFFVDIRRTSCNSCQGTGIAAIPPGELS